MAHPDASRPRQRSAWRLLPIASLVVTAAVGTPLAFAAPDAARGWVAGTVVGAGGCLVLLASAATRLHRRLTAQADRSLAESAQRRSEAAYLAGTVVPELTAALKDPAKDATPAATGHMRASTGPVGAWRPTEPQLAAVQRAVEEALGAAQQRAATADSEREQAMQALASITDDLVKARSETLPTAVRRLGEGASLDTVRAELRLSEYSHPVVRDLVETGLRELAVSERRSAAAQAASAKALSRVQAQAVSILADLREMQDRHGEAVLGDLLTLDHSTSQLGLLTDRLALLMGGRASRSWNKPIPMESILRGAVGRIAAYRRVSLNCSSNTAVAGFAAEGVMHLLAELMDNATSFSAPIDQVHVYVEERSAGIVVTIEDSGLKMADAALRRAEEAVSGATSDLASLQGTRLGLAVVGRLAVKYGISVSYRPSSRGGTGVVVHLPAQLLAQQRTALPENPRHDPSARPRERAMAAAEHTGSQAAGPAPVPAPEPKASTGGSDNGSVTPNGLPVRPPGRTMAAADRVRTPAERPADDRPATRDAGKSFGAFHRARRAAATGEQAPSAEPAPSLPESAPSAEPADPHDAD
ncbi:sensor histidine kinase [Streptomyces sp. HC44]|uniref:histidine kinase n=1 Tax=Streptomyces scabichelini TaxID=2711217 RepID=A0A6G4UWZ6_9ACTN|nr:ATP-binding protein [Streptomyces scabichelini]NGO06163.1 sensor histidine kinase [Streptomyces scabichelini]